MKQNKMIPAIRRNVSYALESEKQKQFGRQTNFKTQVIVLKCQLFGPIQKIARRLTKKYEGALPKLRGGLDPPPSEFGLAPLLVIGNTYRYHCSCFYSI